jgi:hypothetical protein
VAKPEPAKPALKAPEIAKPVEKAPAMTQPEPAKPAVPAPAMTKPEAAKPAEKAPAIAKPQPTPTVKAAPAPGAKPAEAPSQRPSFPLGQPKPTPTPPAQLEVKPETVVPKPAEKKAEPVKPTVQAPVAKPEPVKPEIKAPAIAPAQPAQAPLKPPAIQPSPQPVEAKAKTGGPSPTPTPATAAEPAKNELNRALDSKKTETAETNKAPTETNANVTDQPRLPRLKLKLSPQSMVEPYPLSVALAVTSPPDPGQPVQPNSRELKSLLTPEPQKPETHIPTSFKQILDTLPMPQSAKSLKKDDPPPGLAPSPDVNSMGSS